MNTRRQFLQLLPAFCLIPVVALKAAPKVVEYATNTTIDWARWTTPEWFGWIESSNQIGWLGKWTSYDKKANLQTFVQTAVSKFELEQDRTGSSIAVFRRENAYRKLIEFMRTQ